MDWKAHIRSALGARLDEDVLEELAQHAAATYASARAEGCETGEAERRVTQQIHAWAADPALRRRRPKRDPTIEPPGGSAPPFSTVAQDARYAWRLLRRQPAYAALLISTMALGIAATTVVGSVAYGVLLKPLPWADAPRLVRLYENRQGGTGRFRPMMTNATYRQWYDHPSTLDALGAWSARTAVLSGTTDAQQLKVAGVTPGFFEMLGGRAAIGHLFGQGDEQVGRPSIAVVSYAMWG